MRLTYSNIEVRETKKKRRTKRKIEIMRRSRASPSQNGPAVPNRQNVTSVYIVDPEGRVLEVNNFLRLFL